MTITRGPDRTGFTIYTTPLQSLGRTALVSGASSLLPVFAALLWLTVESEALPAVLSTEAAVTGAFFVVFLRYKLVFAAVTPTHLVKRRMLLPSVSIERSEIDHVVLNRVYRGSSNDSLTQMLVLDAEGRRLYGMNGLFWSKADIVRVAEALEVQVVVDDLPLSRGDYYEMFPMARGWYATRVFRLVMIGAGAIAVGLLVMGVQHLVER
ncbi:hypothetical protein [Frondihabitans australicus]|uniref:PH (Pleckstrin Homology) domain-containing protein n=1 Tax=Frondihabitans australicus TaxID=386892 RepID=A0A495IAV4_9MICO|nr:hypothetical protein [Frondihabitans australicus]RKR73129.1 hypothetical protein C8E83_0215 [Frondihabitans australicus]